MFGKSVHSAQASGFTLLEILIALLVLAIGLLGFAAIQMNAVSSNQEGYFRSQATAIAASIGTKLRANRSFANFTDPDIGVGGDADPGRNLYVGDNQSGVARSWCQIGVLPAIDDSCPVAGTCSCTTSGCDGSQLAGYDIWDVCNNEMGQVGLPDGQIFVLCSDSDDTDGDNCSAGSRYSIAVAWTPSVRFSGVNTGVNANARCNNDFGIAAPRNCIIFEIVP